MTVVDFALPDLASSINPSRIDRNLTSINQVTASWSFPDLPDTVKYDLATLGDFDEVALPAFLNGIGSELTQRSVIPPVTAYAQQNAQFTNATQQQVQSALEPTQPAAPANTLFLPEEDWRNDLRSAFASIAGMRSPEILSADEAVTRFKSEAIGRGVLPKDTKIDGSWSPQMNAARAELMNEEFASRISGNRTGAMSTGNAIDLINKWTSPQGLLTAGISMGFIPNVSRFADKFSKAWRTKDGGDFFDAFKSGVSDIAFPVLNTALLFSGVGNVVTMSRGVLLADDVARGATWASRAMTNPVARAVPGFGKAINVAEEAEHLRRAGMLAQRLQRADYALAKAAGGAMTSWRQATSTILVKNAVRQGMKIGFVGQLENELIGDSQGIGLGGAGSMSSRRTELGFDDWYKRQMTNPLTSGLAGIAEVALTPTSIFDEGFFTKPLTDTYGKARKALMGLPHDRRAGSAVVAAGLEKLRQTDPGRYDQLMADLRKARRLGTDRVEDPQARIAVELLGKGSVEKATDIMWHVIMTAGLQGMSKREAVAALRSAAPEDSNTFQRVLWAFRGQFENQLRPFQNLDVEDVGDRNIWRSYKSNLAAIDSMPDDVRKVRAKKFDEMAAIHDPDEAISGPWKRMMADDLAHHAEVRAGTWKDLLENVTEADIVSVMDEVWDHLDNWDNYTHSLRYLQEHAEFEAGGVGLKRLPFINRTTDWTPSGIGEQLGGTLLPQVSVKKSYIDQMQARVKEGRGRLTIARKDTPTAQQAELLRMQVRTLQFHQRSLLKVEADEVLSTTLRQSLETFAAGQGKSVSKLSNADIGRWIDSTRSDEYVRTSVKAGRQRRYADAVVYTARNGVADPSTARTFIDQKLRTIDEASEMWNNFGVSTRASSLDEKLKALAARTEFMAQEVDVPEELAQKLAAAGYKAVHGHHFGDIADVLDLTGPMPMLSVNDMRRRSLGTFLFRDKGAQDMMSAMRQGRARSIFGEHLRIAKEAGVDLGQWGNRFDLSPASPDMEELMGALRNGVQRIAEDADAAARSKQNLGIITNLGSRFASSGLPYSIYDLDPEVLKQILGDAFTDEGYNVLAGALRKAKQTGFEYQGLAAFEDYLVANSWTRATLGLFAKSAASSELGAWETLKDSYGLMRGGQKVAGIRTLRDRFLPQSIGSAAVKGTAAGALAYNQAEGTGQDEWKAALYAGTGVAVTGRLLNPRTFARFALGYSGYAMAQEMGADRNTGLLVGAAAGFGGGAALTKTATALTKEGGMFDRRAWFQYSKLGDTARHVRDRVRFSLSPFWDIQRYTEGAMANLVADLPEGVVLPVTAKPMARFLKDAEQRYGEAGMTVDGIVNEWRKASRGWYDPDTLDSAQAWFHERGIMGYSPNEWMAATYGQLTRQGMSREAAVDTVKKIYTYGTAGRSGMERSINFVFFPFSFQKKYLGDIAKFMSKDVGRAVLVHDAVRTWDALYEEYDLGEFWRDHIPVLDQLKKINALGYGISPGQFGGINRPLYDVVKRTPGFQEGHDAIMNAFLPQAWEIRTQADWDGQRRFVKQMIPIWRDAEDMLDDMRAQGHVLFSQSHVTPNAEADLGWQEYSDFTRSVHDLAKQNGTTYAGLMRSSDPAWEPLQNLIRKQRRDIELKYPEFSKSRDRAIERNIARAQEMNDILLEPTSEADLQLAEFAAAADQLDQLLGGSTLQDPDLVPAEQASVMRRLAADYVRRNPAFMSHYRRYFQNRFGPITLEL